MRPLMIEWDGTHLPKGLEELPPGKYLVSLLYDDDDELSDEEDAAVQAGLDEAEAGHILPLEDVIREIRARAHRVCMSSSRAWPVEISMKRTTSSLVTIREQRNRSLAG